MEHTAAVKEKAGRVARALSVPQVITVLCLVVMGANAWVQLSLQRDMAVKTKTLQHRVAQAGALTSTMNGSLSGLQPLAQTSRQMAAALTEIQVQSSQMNVGLATLDSTVSHIHAAVKDTSGSVAISTAQLQHLRQASQSLSDALHQLKTSNSDVISNLSAMESDQKGINSNLEQMNAKTAVLP